MSLRTNQMGRIVAAITLSLGLLTPALAQKLPDVGGQGAFGQITAVNGSAITVQRRGYDAKTYAITPTTITTINKKLTTVDKLCVGQFASVTSVDGTTSTQIDVHRRSSGNGVAAAAIMLAIFGAAIYFTNQKFHHDEAAAQLPGF